MRPEEQADRAKRESGEGREPAFRFLLIRRDRVLADPAAFETTNATWKAGDEFLDADGVQRYRILDMVLGGPPHTYNGVLLVELVDGRSGRAGTAPPGR